MGMFERTGLCTRTVETTQLYPIADSQQSAQFQTSPLLRYCITTHCLDGWRNRRESELTSLRTVVATLEGHIAAEVARW